LVLAVLAAFALAAVAGAVALGAGSPAVGPNEVQQSAEKEVNRDVPNSQSNAHVPSSHVPRPATVSAASPGSELAAGFAGLNHVSQRTADGGNQFSLEPPDQGLCAGSGEVVEAVNDVFATYDTSGQRNGGPTSLTKFFTGQSQIVRHDTTPPTATYGPFLSDPKCYYDPGLGRFFLTVLEIEQDPATGAFGTHSAILIAASTTATPSTSRGDWHLYSIDTSNDGGSAADTVDGASGPSRTLPGDSGCPCFGDQPLIGADRYGFYVTTNEFSIAGPQFDGAQVYAFDKAGLAAGTLRMQYVADGLPLAEGTSYSLQPATSPTTGDWAAAANGTEYMLSALDFDATLDNRIGLWTLTNTKSLTLSGSGLISIASSLLPSEVYGQPPDAVQKSGPTPLASFVQQLYGAKNPTSGSAPQEELLAGNDDRMNQVVYAGGNVWGALNTVVKTDNGPSHVGSAYFVVSPAQGKVASQGYVAVNQANLLFPSIAVTSSGKAVYTATLSGTGYFPSAVYATIDPAGGPGPVRIAAAGLGPDDGFTGYPPFGGPTGRWGDYSAAVPDGAGGAWLATEYVGQTCTAAQFAQDTTCGGTRTILANWGTYVMHVTP
jgi:hypothetical protein